MIKSKINKVIAASLIGTIISATCYTSVFASEINSEKIVNISEELQVQTNFYNEVKSMMEILEDTIIYTDGVFSGFDLDKLKSYGLSDETIKYIDETKDSIINKDTKGIIKGITYEVRWNEFYVDIPKDVILNSAIVASAIISISSTVQASISDKAGKSIAAKVISDIVLAAASGLASWNEMMNGSSGRIYIKYPVFVDRKGTATLKAGYLHLKSKDIYISA